MALDIFNLDNIVINRAIAGTMLDKTTKEPMFYVSQITDPSLETTGEQADVVDAMGIKIASFDRSKEATFTGSSALVNLGLAAAQFGGEKMVADADHKIIVPMREVLVAKDGKATLSETPVDGSVAYINAMTKDGGLGVAYKLAATEGESADEAPTFTITGKEITLPLIGEDGGAPTDGTKFIVFYEKEVTSGVKITNSAEMFAKGGEFILEVLLADICDTTKPYHAYIVFPNAKMANETTIDFNNEATHGFTINAMQDYCDENKTLFEIIVTE